MKRKTKIVLAIVGTILIVGASYLKFIEEKDYRSIIVVGAFLMLVLSIIIADIKKNK